MAFLHLDAEENAGRAPSRLSTPTNRRPSTPSSMHECLDGGGAVRLERRAEDVERTLIYRHLEQALV